MKYGETLQQRSIPEWENYNVDYNDLKRLIKIRTTRGQGEALSIPGHGNEAKALKAFENEFYHQLTDQHQRVDLFVQSKAGEINRRLIHLDKQIGQLQQRYALHQPGKISVKRLERYSRAEEAAEKAGEEIKSLARFVGAQKLAFVKILKKYRKWTGSSTLESRFRPKVLDQPTTFSKRDFGPLLTQYTEVLAAVRAPFQHGGGDESKMHQPFRSKSDTTRDYTPKIQLPRPQQNHRNSIAAQLQNVFQGSLSIEFDNLLATSPLGKSGGKASYWIHPDNLVELHVLLLQYTRLRKINGDSKKSAVNGSGQQPCKESMDGNNRCLVNSSNDDAGLIVCDDLEKFARRSSSAPISDFEGSAGCLLEKAAGIVRYLPTGEAVLAVSTRLNDAIKSPLSGAFQSVVIKRKAVRYLFDSGLSKTKVDQLLREENSQNGQELKAIREWLTSHKEVQPLVKLQCKRTRFVGLHNSGHGGMWATLDRDIVMKATPEGFFSSEEGDLAFDKSEDSGFARFPFAVLEVRCEGGFGKEFLRTLDKSHLTERIRGFSMVTHAVATLCKPQGMPPPYWLPALDQDLRKIPATVKTATSRCSRNQLLPSPASTAEASLCATSDGDRPTSRGVYGPAAESSATSVPEVSEPSPQKVFKKKRRSRRGKSLRQEKQGNEQIDHQRYWNEYENGDENSENEPYAIYIDPNQSTFVPGFPTISKATSSLAFQARRMSNRAKRWLRLSDERTVKTPDQTASPEDDSDLEDSPTAPLISHAKTNNYSTFFKHRHVVNHAVQARDLLLTRCCIAFYAASFVLLIVAALLASTGRRKAHLQVDAGIITGVTFSLVFVVAAVGCAVTRQERMGLFQRLCVFVTLTVVCACSGILLGGVVDG
ncbi:MAG: hypothetical protein Q9213_007539 [Squamulea squamosa]